MPPAYKYAAEMAEAGVTDCPPQTAAPQAATAYRFVKVPIGQESLLPMWVMDPGRFLDAPCCKAFGLSMWRSPEEAQAAYLKFVAKYGEKFREQNGTHLATVSLLMTHGAHTPCRRDGHFTFYEYDGVDLVPHCTNSEELAQP